jgi:hypothetical protein
MKFSRVSALSLGVVFAVFALGYANPAFTGKPGGCPDHPSCNDDDGGDGSGKDALYSAVITGAVSGVSGKDHWRGNFAGKKGLGRNTGGTPPDEGTNVGQLDLSFFTFADPVGPFSMGRGLACFPNGGVVYIGQAVVKSGKHGQAEGSFWFRAKADNATTDVGYLLTMIGTFNDPGVWPPSGMTTMTLLTWKLSAGNEDSTVRNISCLGDGEFDDFSLNGLEDFVKIVVKTE